MLTYGLANNDPEQVRAQQQLGVQGVIVDDVVGVVSAFGRGANTGCRNGLGGGGAVWHVCPHDVAVLRAPDRGSGGPGVAAYTLLRCPGRLVVRPHPHNKLCKLCLFVC